MLLYLWLFVVGAVAVQVPAPDGSPPDSSLALLVGSSTAAVDALGAEFSQDLEGDGDGFANAVTEGEIEPDDGREATHAAATNPENTMSVAEATRLLRQSFEALHGRPPSDEELEAAAWNSVRTNRRTYAAGEIPVNPQTVPPVLAAYVFLDVDFAE